MIPLRLTLKNFMSYRDPAPVDFAPLHTACLTGENGAGKSALLTAMTWALWGETPAHAADEDLIAQGETEMSVDFEFALGDQEYRVLRARSRKGKSTIGRITFQVRDPLLGWRDISGDTARQTQQTITGRLHMDHETFVNSAFLRQGKADEFTTKNPTERKDILARILGLEEYDRLAERARERARDLEAERRGLMLQIQELDTRIARKAELQQQAAEVAIYLEQARTILAGAQSAAEQVRNRLAVMEKDRQELENVRARAAQDEIAISRGERLIGELQARITQNREIVAQRDSITANYNKLQTLRAWERHLADLAHQQREIESEIHRLERLIDAARNTLVNESQMLKRSIAEQTKLATGRADNERLLAEVREQLAAFAQMEADLRTAHEERDNLQQQVSALQGANEKLKEEADGITTRLKLLDEAIADAEAGRRRGEVPCPLCGMLLEPDARDRVRAGYQQDINVRRQQWKANKQRSDAAQKQIDLLTTRITGLDEKLKARRMAEKREATIEQTIRAAEEAQVRLDREQASLQAVLVAVEAGAYAESERAALQTAQAQLAALAYDPNEHRRVSAETQQLESYERRYAALQAADENLKIDGERLVQEQENVAGHRDRLARERNEETRLTLAVAGLDDLRRQAREQEQQVSQAREREDRLSREEAALTRQLEGIADDEHERAAKATLLTQMTADKAVYDELAKAFGKSGVQAMIIEQVVPELADDANTLLGRMTDNRMQLSFETQRAAKTRDSVIETLDIKITDGAGIARKYEMFSGGESFRINFAVRIALSKLLARRAGAQLQTLIIDEGFGTQDAQGRERLVQAIRSIQDDFEKILVITHLDELKDEFTSRIDVVKTSRGSVATVN